MVYTGAMSNYSWIPEPSPTWDADKNRIVGEAPAGVFDDTYTTLEVGDPAPGDWWRVEADGAVAGYGWMDVVWGDAEILVATAPEARGKGVGSFALAQLGKEAAGRGIGYVCNIVRPTHPAADDLRRLLHRNGFQDAEDGRLKKRSG